MVLILLANKKRKSHKLVVTIILLTLNSDPDFSFQQDTDSNAATRDLLLRTDF